MVTTAEANRVRRFECKTGSRNAFYEIRLHSDNNTEAYGYTANWGRIGTQGQQQVKNFGTAAAAREAYNAKVDEKIAKGYKEAYFTEKTTTPQRQQECENCGGILSTYRSMEADYCPACETKKAEEAKRISTEPSLEVQAAFFVLEQMGYRSWTPAQNDWIRKAFSKPVRMGYLNDIQLITMMKFLGMAWGQKETDYFREELRVKLSELRALDAVRRAAPGAKAAAAALTRMGKARDAGSRQGAPNQGQPSKATPDIEQDNKPAIKRRIRFD